MSPTSSDEDYGDGGYSAAHCAATRFAIVLCFRHPSVDVEAISAQLNWVPTSTCVGQHRWEAHEERRGDRSFFRCLVELVDRLDPHRFFIARYIETGGEITFSVQLFGQTNIGDDISAENLMRLGTMGIGLRVEVLPEWL